MLSNFEPAQTRRAIAIESLSYVAQTVLFPFGYLRSRHRTRRARDLRTLVFVHGLQANRASFFPLQAYLAARGYRRQLSFNYPSRGSIEALALRLKREVDTQIKGGRIDIIAHSMGGLVARFYLQQLGGARRVDRLITLGTPHHGTEASVYIPQALVRQLHPQSPLIQRLNALPLPEHLQIATFGAGGDVLVLPRSSALWPEGQGEMLPGHGHLSMLLAPKVMRAVARSLESRAARAVHVAEVLRGDA